MNFTVSSYLNLIGALKDSGYGPYIISGQSPFAIRQQGYMEEIFVPRAGHSRRIGEFCRKGL